MKIATITMALVMAGLFAHAQGEPVTTQSPAQPTVMEQKADTGHMNKKEKKHRKHGKKSAKAEKSEKTENTEKTEGMTK